LASSRRFAVSRGLRGVLFGTLLLTAGCYVYQPVRPSDALLDSTVRATVSSRQAAELAPVLRNVTPQVSGKLTQLDAGFLMLDVPLFGGTQGLSRAPVHNRVRISFEDLVSLERRRISPWRTGVALSALGAAVGTTWVLISGDKESGDKPRVGSDNAIRIRIPLGFGLR
jgi:hypothetical protein